MFDNVSRYIRRRRRQAQIRNELAALSRRELDDIGIHRSAIDRIAREGAREL